MSKILTLHLKSKWWDQIIIGVKTIEYRLATAYWHKRLIGKNYDEIHIWLGYPKKTETHKLLKMRIGRIWLDTIIHEEFGNEPVNVFCIELKEQLNER